MKKTFCTFGILIFCLLLKAQTHTESFVICKKPFEATSELQNDRGQKITIKYGLNKSASREFSIKTEDLETFAEVFKIQFLNRFKDSLDECPDKDQILLTYARKFFINIKATNIQDTATPVAGILKVKDSLAIAFTFRYIRSGKIEIAPGDTWNYKRFSIEKVSIEIHNGFIQNLTAYIKYDDGISHAYALPFPVGISSIGNYKKYSACRLIAIESPYRFKTLKRDNPAYEKAAKNKEKSAKVDSILFLKLSDILNYDYCLGVERRDYSPANIKTDILGGESVILHKEPTNRLFEADIFSDFLGLQEDKPNGLVQIEMDKKINLNTTQNLNKPWLYWLFHSSGWFHYISPAITLSKIEQHNRRLILGDLDSIRQTPGIIDTGSFNSSIHRYVSAMELYQYQWFSAGFDLNILNLSNHDTKYDVEFNFGCRLGVTPVTDSLTKNEQSTISKTGFVDNYSVNTLQFYPEIRARFLPEERFNFSLSNKFVYMLPINQKVQMVSYSKDNLVKFSPQKFTWINVFEMLMAIQVNPNSKLFGRVRLNWEMSNIKQNFAQVQIGYSTFILGK